MAKPKAGNNGETIHSFRFSLAGLVIFSVALVAGTGLVTYGLTDRRPKGNFFNAEPMGEPAQVDKERLARVGPWGELLTQNITLERPPEYLAREVNDPKPETWRFEGKKPGDLKATLVAYGLTEAEAGMSARPERMVPDGAATLLRPDEDFLMTMKPEERQRLYGAFYGMGVGRYLDFPFTFPGDSIERIYGDAELHPEDVAVLKQLVYRAEDGVRFSDYWLLLRKIPTPERRLTMARALSRQPAVLPRLRVAPDSDIDKIAAYWGKIDNVRFTDLRPMLAALRELPHGGTMSLMYFLPPFARMRLYTFPLPGPSTDPVMDCHWTTFNFSRSEPDNRFCDPNFTVQYLAKNYYRIEAPSLYGDLIMYANENQEVKHSAVFLADDLAFTKYGNNYMQPWMVVRLKDMQALYPKLQPVFYRKRTD